MAQKKTKKKRLLTVVGLSVGIVMLLVILAGYRIYRMAMKANVATPDKAPFSLYIPTGADVDQVKDSLYLHHIIIDHTSFEWILQQKDYAHHVRPGHYLVNHGMSNNQLVNMLRGGLQTPVKVTFNNLRTVAQLAGRIGEQLEADSIDIMNLLNNRDTLQALGFTLQTLPAMFLPNTYEFYWNTDADKFVRKMKREYDRFWTDEKKQQARSITLSPVEVSILASIVDKETNKTDEMPRIAGVYLNRLKAGWLLQADPTLVFAVGDFELKRVLNVHKEVESPYNTYKYTGLPPGPICIPSLASINAVLHAEKHNFYYFCAKDDFSGYHNFAKTLTEHNRNAERYQHALRQLR